MNSLANSFWIMPELLERRNVPDLYDFSPALMNCVQGKLNKYRTSEERINLIRHFPPDLNQHLFLATGKCRLKSKSGKGYAANFQGFENIDDYLREKRGSQSRRKLRSYIRKLEKCFDVKYKMHYGSIDWDEYLFIMDKMKEFLKYRFDQRGENHMSLPQWKFLTSRCFELIHNNCASLFVIYNERTPIIAHLNYHFGNTCYGAIRAWDMNYASFRLGQIELYKLLDWCIKNNYQTYDMGYKDPVGYKRRWCNSEYEFENHIFYKRSNIGQYLLANCMKSGFDIKQKLRDFNLPKLLKLRRGIVKRNKSNTSQVLKRSVILNAVPEHKHLIRVRNSDKIEEDFKQFIYDFQYKNSINSNELKFYKLKENKNTLIIQGSEKVIHLEL